MWAVATTSNIWFTIAVHTPLLEGFDMPTVDTKYFLQCCSNFVWMPFAEIVNDSTSQACSQKELSLGQSIQHYTTSTHYHWIITCFALVSSTTYCWHWSSRRFLVVQNSRTMFSCFSSWSSVTATHITHFQWSLSTWISVGRSSRLLHFIHLSCNRVNGKQCHIPPVRCSSTFHRP